MGRIFKRKSRLTGKELAVYWIAYYHRGKEVRQSTHTSVYEDARNQLRERLEELGKGTYVPPNRRRVTVETLLDRLRLHYEAQERASLPTVLGHIAAWTREIGPDRAMDLTTVRLQRITQAWRRDGKAPATINRRLAALRRAFRLGRLRIDADQLDFAELQLPENSPRGKYLTAEAFAAIYAHLPAYLRDFFEFAYLTGIRKTQLAATTWAHLNAETWTLRWDPREVKNREGHEIALDGRPLDIIQGRRDARAQRGDLACPYVFDRKGRHIGDFRRAWSTACKRAGFPVGRKNGGFVFHNTRHTAVTNLVNAGTAAHEAMGVSGHRTRSVFDRYSIKLHEQTRAALRRTTAYVQSLSTTPKVVPLAPKEPAGADTVHTCGTHLDKVAT